MNKKYYHAYEERYKTIHEKGTRWSSDIATPIVLETLKKYKMKDGVLEIGCGEGRDAHIVLDQGYSLMATDVSLEAIRYCKETYPKYVDHFSVLDCIKDSLDHKFDFIYAVAVIHMLVLDEDRDAFYQFIYNHLNGYALICSMGNGQFEMQTNIEEAFDIQPRNHEIGKVDVASTSCRMVSFETFEKEIERNQLEIVEKGLCSSMPDFNELMYVVVRRK